ncbi:hypothetical protein [Streptomyces sp. RK75]|uniref:hypothetical protein n=1 Tax=Streptomyces sp. RK75 TaxID=2824895 RepID=UPI001FFC66E1|nr:hypothetical protein [Streptomyces sp. RK75]
MERNAPERGGPELAVLVGLQAAGKSSFHRQHLSGEHTGARTEGRTSGPVGGHLLVSKDLFPRSARNKQRRQLRLIDQALAAGQPVAVDNTNPSSRCEAPTDDPRPRSGARGTQRCRAHRPGGWSGSVRSASSP